MQFFDVRLSGEIDDSAQRRKFRTLITTDSTPCAGRTDAGQGGDCFWLCGRAYRLTGFPSPLSFLNDYLVWLVNTDMFCIAVEMG
jgi:hypothetical protein